MSVELISLLFSAIFLMDIIKSYYFSSYAFIHNALNNKRFDKEKQSEGSSLEDLATYSLFHDLVHRCKVESLHLQESYLC